MSLTFEQMYADLVEAANTEPPAQSFSVRQFAEDAEVTESQARHKLKRWLRNERIEGQLFVIDGHREWRYWFSEGDK